MTKVEKRKRKIRVPLDELVISSSSNIDVIFDKWIEQYCCCWSCIHGIEKNLFGQVFCEQPGMAGGWNGEYAMCEEHDFRDPKLHKKHQEIMDEHYKKHEAEYALPD